MDSGNDLRYCVDTDYKAEKLLQVNNCGSERVIKNDYTILRATGRKDYHILYLQNGWVPAEIGEVKTRVDAGSCIVYRPGVRQMYSLNAKNDPTTFFIHFTGAAAAEALSELDDNESMVYKISDRTAFERLFQQIIHTHNERGPKYTLVENMILMRLIVLLVQSSLPVDMPVQHDVQRVAAYIREHYNEEINLDQCAANIHLSRSRFSHIFTKEIGIPPHRFILNLRLEYAKWRLLDSLMNISEISENAGFSDPQYFSRIFHQYTGVSPSTYRKQNIAPIAFTPES